MICKKKQIQTRILPTNTKTHLKIQKNTSKSYKKHQQISQQNSYDIAPWHTTKSKSKLLQHDFLQEHKPRAKSNAKKLLQQQQTQKKQFDTLELTPFVIHQKLTLLSNVSGSPSKLNMLECSFRFEEYERQKVKQIENIFVDQLKDYRQKVMGNTMMNSEKNFILRNIKNAFQLENPYLEKHQFPQYQKKKTIFDKTRQQLLLNNEMLNKQSQQLERNFVSMRNHSGKQKYYKQPSKYCYKLPIETVWNMMYYEKSPNPQSAKRVRRVNAIERKRQNFHTHRSFGGLSMKSQHVKEKNKDLAQGDQNKLYIRKHQRQLLSRRLGRMSRSKNKKINDNFEGDSVVRKGDNDKLHSLRRIHSIIPQKRHEEKSCDKLLILKDEKQNFSKTALQTFQPYNDNIDINNNHSIKPRSHSALSGRTNYMFQKQFKKIKLNSAEKSFRQMKNFLLQGSQCELAQVIAD